MKNKRGFEMSFAWIFAIIAGAAILFLAIYTASQIVKTKQYELDIRTANKLAILIDPLETSLESGRSSVISFSSEARIYNDRCQSYGNFGKQSLGVTVLGVGEEWQEPAYASPVYNKYIFSEKIEQGREFSVLLKPLNLPFKVTDLVILTSQEYCFVNAPEDFEDELGDLVRNVSFADSRSGCSGKIVCFSRSDCDINVLGDLDSGYVSKEGKSLYYTEDLLYTAIFSSPETYECNVQRLMLRLVNLALIYKDKIKVLGGKGCNSLLDSQLSELMNLARNLDSSRDLSRIQDKAREINIVNNAASCKLY